MGVYTHSQGNWLSRRGTFLIILIAFHLLLFWALKSGFALKLVKTITEPIKAEIINEVKPELPPPPPPEVKMELPPVQVPPVLVDIPNPPPPPPAAIIAPQTHEITPPAPPQPPARVVRRTSAGYAQKPDVADYYPSESKRLNEEGVSKLRLCFDVKGKITDTSVAESSGKERLDAAAVKMGPRFRMKPGTVDGKPEAGCVVVPIRFSLKDAGY